MTAEASRARAAGICSADLQPYVTASAVAIPGPTVPIRLDAVDKHANQKPN